MIETRVDSFLEDKTSDGEPRLVALLSGKRYELTGMRAVRFIDAMRQVRAAVKAGVKEAEPTKVQRKRQQPVERSQS